MKQDFWTYNKPLSMTGLGGGATSLSNAGGSLFSYNDAAYDNFFTKGKPSINISNSSYDLYNFSGNADSNSGGYTSLQTIIDHNTDKFYSGYNSAIQAPSSYSFTYSGGTYASSGLSTPASFYRVGGTSTALSGYAASPISGETRGITIAYLGDDTPVFVFSCYNNSRIYFFNYPNGTYIGYLTVATGGTYDASPSNNMSMIAFDGTALLVFFHDFVQTTSYVYRYAVPSNTSAINSGTLSTAGRWQITNISASFGMNWGGDNRIYIGTMNGASQYQLSNLGTGYTASMSGTSTLVATYSISTGAGTNYSLAMDYKNRKLVIGGYSNNVYNVFGE